jgi:hypothetical protein
MVLFLLAGIAGVLTWVALASGTQPYETYKSRVTSDGPLADFRFDDATGSTKLADSAGSYSATNNGIALGLEGPFGGGRSGSFGGEAYAALPGDPLEGAKEWTAEAWVDWSGGASYKQPVFDFGSSSSNYIYLTPATSVSGHKMLLELHTTGGSSAQVTASKLGSGSWNYVAVTETAAGTLTLYENGEQVGQTTGAAVFPASLGSTTTDYLGKSLVTGEPNFKGSLSNVAFYGKALSASQVKVHWDDAEFPVNTAAPSTTGIAKDGNTLTAKSGSWSGLTPITFSYQWTRCNEKGESCTEIHSASEAKYVAVHEDVGSTLRAVVIATNSAGSGTATTPATAKIEPVPPVNTALPTVSGEAKDGRLLSVTNGSWEGTPPFSYSYQWEICAVEKCKKLSGATSSSYRIISSEIGETLRVVVTAENAAGAKSAKSAQTATITAGAPVNTSPPVISGEAKDGKTLSGSQGSWAGTSPITYAYQWQRCNEKGESCANVTSATSSTYGLSPSDIGSTMRVVVTATNAQGSTPATSEKTLVVAAIPPSSTSLPTVSGEVKDGQTLTAGHGGWGGSPSITYGYEWQRCNEKGEACKGIGGPSEASYVAGHEDVGSTLRVKVTATNAGGSASATSEKTAVVVAQAPSNTSLPTVSGEVKDGQTLTAGHGGWGGSPSITYSYQWQRCDEKGEACKGIGGASEASYVAGHEDVGSTLRVKVTATNAGGSASATSEKTAVVVAQAPSNTSLPTVSGEVKDGQTLTAGHGGWGGSPSITYSYQWQRCDEKGESCTAVSGASGETYALSSSDVGDTIRVLVTASNAAGSSSSSSEATTAVLPLAPASTAKPTISGETRDGQTLSASTGTWSGSTPLSYAYQWQRCDEKGESCAAITGATSSAYTLAHADVGSTLRVVVTASNPAGSASGTSDASAAITAVAPSSSAPPTVSGEARDGRTLAASTGEWSGTPPTGYAYQWRRCDEHGESCGDVSGATGASYTEGPEDVGHTLRVTVTASNAAGSSPASSEPTAAVLPEPPTNSSAPSISGEAEVGQTLTAGDGEWAGTPPLSFTYQWQSCDSLDESCLPLSGATAASYTLQPSDAGATVRVLVTATNEGGESTASSAASGLVAEAAAECTDSWTGADGDGLWQTAGNWSTGSAPASGDDACIGPETTVRVTSTSNSVASVKDEGELVIAGGSLDVTSAGTPSTVATLSLEGATLTGSATLGVSGSLSLNGNSSISVLTVRLQPTASGATVHECARLALDGATLDNEGHFTLAPDSAALWLEDGAQLRNEGTFTDESIDPACGYGTVGFSIYNAGGTSPAVTNTSSFHADGGTGNTLDVQIPFDNKGAVTAESGTLELSEGGVPEQAANGTWDVEGDGAIVFGNGTFLIEEGVDLSHVTVTAATVEIAGKGPPVSTSAPDVSGQAEVGHVLSSDTGHWTGARPLSYAYQWQRCDSEGEGCADIEGATEESYDPTTEDVGSTLRVTVKATNSEGSATAESASSSIVGYPPVNTAPPTVSGTAQDGQTVTTSNGTWEGGGAITYGYQWQRCRREEGGGVDDIALVGGFGTRFNAASGEGCTDIEGATSASYTLLDEDVEAVVRVVVTAHDADGETSETSDETEAVLPPAAPEATAAPTISGSAQRGRKLTATPGGWHTVGAISYAYQWQRCDSAGESCSGISGAVGSTYVAGADDVDHTLRVVVTASNAVGSASNTSAPTGLVAETNCTDTWNGSPSGGSWATGSNWSAGHAPEASDVACIGAGTTVQITSGTNHAGQLEDEGSLVLSGGSSLELADSSKQSTTASLSLHDADLAGPGSLDVSESLTLLGEAELTGTGSLVIEPEARGVINAASGCEPLTISHHTLVNEGVIDYEWGTLDLGSGATLENKGRLEYETRSSCHEPQIGLTGDPEAQILNTGTFERNAAGSGGIGVPFNNAGTVEAHSGRLDFSGGGVSEEVATGSWSTSGGTIALTAGTFLVAEEVDLSEIEVTGATVIRGSLEAPVSQTIPGISGELIVAKTLSASPGTWRAVPQPSYAYQWERCEAGGEGCSDIAGATSQQYTLAPADAGATMRVRVTATNSKGSASSTSEATEAVAPAPPVNTALPAISGTAQDGHTLTATTGTWEGVTPITYAYQWQRCPSGGGSCTGIEGATASSYTLAHEDVGSTIEVVVTATNPGGSTEGISSPSSQIAAASPVNAAAPTIGGEPVAGEALRANPGTWEGTPPFSYAYEWQLCNAEGAECAAIEGATGRSYTPTAGQIGQRLRVVVTASNGGGSASEHSSAAPVSAATAPSNTAAPTITGSARDGQTLTVDPGTWDGTNPSFSYQWQSCNPGGGECQDIEGETGPAYTVGSGDIGSTIRVVVEAANSSGSAQATSAPTAEVKAGPPAELEAPSISGVTDLGETLAAHPGEWGGTENSFSFQWESCNPEGGECQAIAGATGSEYQLGAGDVGTTLRLRVAVSDEQATLSAVTAPTALIGAEPATLTNTLAPSITGAAQVGQKLTIDAGSWAGEEEISYAYEWQRCDAGGSDCDALEGATGETFTLSSEDLGKTLRAVVTASDANGSQRMTTPATATVAAEGAPTLEEPPAVYGAAIEGQALDATTGEWAAEGAQLSYGYQWQRCAADGTGCEPVTGATAAAYTVQEADGGHTLRLLVTAHDAYGEASAMSSPTAIVAPAKLTMLVGPSISGAAETGHQLAADPGIWTALGHVTYTYAWERCDESGNGCVAISGATGASYTPAAADLGHTDRVTVTAADGAEETASSSPPTGVVVTPETAPENTAAPSIEGVFTVGEMVVASPGTWAGAEPIGYAYQWQSCAPGQECADIEGATGESYVLGSGDAGSRLRVLVTATNSLASTTAISVEGEAVGAAGPPSVSESEGPSIYGAAEPGGALFVDNGSWSGSRPLVFHYQWKRCNAAGEECADIEAAGNPSYHPQAGDVGSTIRVEVSVTNGLGSAEATSPPVVVTATGEADADQAIEVAQATDPSILAPADSATVEGQELKPSLADSGRQLDAGSTLTGSALSKQTTGEFELDTQHGELGIEPATTRVGAATLPTLVNGVAAVYAGSAAETDTIVRPEPLGVTSLLQLRSAGAPTSFSWRVHISPSQSLEKLTNGSVAVVEASEEEPEGEGEGGETGFATDKFAGRMLAGGPGGASPFDGGGEEGFGGGAAEQEHEKAVSEEAPEGELPAVPTAETPASSLQPGELHPQDTEQEYDSASEAITQAEAEASGTVLTVIQAPVVKDAHGEAVSAALSVEGESVALTVAPAEGATYPLTAETAASAPSGAAAPGLRAFALAPTKGGPKYYGLGSAYQTPEDLSDSIDSPGHFDPRITLHSHAALKVAITRAFVPYNLEQEKATNPEWGQLETWLRTAGRDGLKPLITFSGPRKGQFCSGEPECKNDRVAPESFGKGLKEEIATLAAGVPEVPATPEVPASPGHPAVPAKPAVPAIPPVEYFATWNEPDLPGNGVYQGTAEAPAAANLWRAAEAARQASGCVHCVMLAGEFSEYQEKYVHSYTQTLVKQENAPVTLEGKKYTPRKPTIWGLHDYKDVVYWPEHHENGKAEHFITAMKGVTSKIWLTELGVELESGSKFSSLESGVYQGHTLKRGGKVEKPNQLQVEAANDFLKLGTLPHIEMLDYYQYKAHGEKTSIKFDDGLLNPTAATPESKNWREAYCVLALGKKTGCPTKIIKVLTLKQVLAKSAKVAATLDPAGLPTEFSVRYGTTTSYGRETTHVALPNESGEQTVTAQISGLTPCTTYHYQFDAENEGNEGVPSESADQTFKTSCEGGAVIEDPACEAHVLPADDDESTGSIGLPFTIDYYGRNFSSLYVNNNGNVTFDASLRQWTPYVLEASAERPIMAPFMGDVDTRGGGSEGGGGGGGGGASIARAASSFVSPDIPGEVEGGESGVTRYGATTYDGHPAFCVDWPYVGYWNKHTDKLNDFQLMIVSRSDIGSDDFEFMFNYDQVKWETGDFNGGHDGLGGESAAVGFSNGDGTGAHSFEISGSRVNGALLDSSSNGLIHRSRESEVLGRYVFDVFPH